MQPSHPVSRQRAKTRSEAKERPRPRTWSRHRKRERVVAVIQRRGGLPLRSPCSQATIDYKNVALLRKCITVEGKILPRRISRVTATQQRHIARAVKNARIVGLIPFVSRTQPARY